MPIYMIWFGHLERTVKHYKLIHVALDDHIPFCPVSIVPYLLWFLYVAVTVMYFFFKDKDDYFKCCTFLFTGMTVFLLVSTLWPNGHNLRPFILPRDNIFTKLVACIYRADTPTNLWPSIHYITRSAVISPLQRAGILHSIKASASVHWCSAFRSFYRPCLPNSIPCSM